MFAIVRCVFLTVLSDCTINLLLLTGSQDVCAVSHGRIVPVLPLPFGSGHKVLWSTEWLKNLNHIPGAFAGCKTL